MIDIKKIGVVGAGQMGRGIAQVAAMSGYQVCLYDVDADGLQVAINFIQQQMGRGVEKEKWDQLYVDQTMGLLFSTTELAALSDCDLLIEAATENKKIKFQFIQTNTC